MSDWRVTQTYGFGAAGLRLRPASYRPEPDASLVAELRAALAGEGLRGVFGDATAALTALALGVVLLFALVSTWSRDHSDAAVEVALWRTPVEALPVPEVEPPPEPPAVAPPAPEPPPQVARPAPEPPQPVAPPAPTRRPPAAKPLPEPAPMLARRPPEPTRRSQPKRPEPPPRQALRPEVPALAALPTPAAAPQPTRRERRVPAQAHATPRVEPIASPEPFEVATARSPRPARAERIAAAPPADARGRRPEIGIAAPPAAPAAPEPSQAPRSQRTSRPTGASRERRQRASAPALEVPGMAAARQPPPPAAAPAPERSARPEAAPRRTARADSPRLSGVPLGSLAACVSDRDEHALRQRVLAAVRGREQCTSHAGTWRFVETKNLNAFLMWIERAGDRRGGDRCAELTLALECLAGRHRGETRG